MNRMGKLTLLSLEKILEQKPLNYVLRRTSLKQFIFSKVADCGASHLVVPWVKLVWKNSRKFYEKHMLQNPF